MSQITRIKCKDCPYYTGIQNHGHGENWGECLLFKIVKPAFSCLVQKGKFYSVHLKDRDLWDACIFKDDHECFFFELDVY